MNRSRYPIVGIPCDVITDGLNPFHGVGEKYINAIANGAQVFPLLIPAQGPGEDLETMKHMTTERLLDMVDGLFLPGSPSNVEPRHYGNESSATPASHDPQRDARSLPLIYAAIKRRIPILAVCRGMQELNVAFGGTLHQELYKVPGIMDHREDKTQPREGRYADAHEVRLVAGGVLAVLAGVETVRVNSLHGQGIKTLGHGLVTEAIATDGLIEALRVEDRNYFVIGVQWHPEWRFRDNVLSTALFKAFGEAVRQE